MNNKRKLNPKIIRVGDLVKIINPEVFIRCGYPLDFEKMLFDVRDKYKQDVDAFMNVILMRNGINHGDISANPYYEVANKLFKAITYMLLHVKGFGGKERKIYTENREEIINEQFFVHKIFFVKTGKYYPIVSSGGYFEQKEYEPAYLDNQEAHKILILRDFNIEAKNVEKVYTNGKQ